MDSLPRILLFDLTSIGQIAATGQLKATLFADWPRDRLMQVHGGTRPRLGVLANGVASHVTVSSAQEVGALVDRIAAFAPELIIYRPVPNTPWLHQVAMAAIARLETPLVTWIMDDWPAALHLSDPQAAASLDPDLRALFRQSAGALSIGAAMSEAFALRYERPFAAFANGVSETDWPLTPRVASGGVRLRYAGGLAEDMGLASLIAVAAAVERLAANGVDVRLEIGARPYQVERFGDRFAAFGRTSIHIAELPPEAYRRWISDADILLIAYNFDEASKAYVRYSIANKLPECLASGAAVLAVGPRDVATMALLAELGCSLNVFDDTPAAIDAALRELVASADRRKELASRARGLAFQRFDLARIRANFAAWLSKTAIAGRNDPALRAARQTEGHLWRMNQVLHSGVDFASIGDKDALLTDEQRSENRRSLLDRLSAFAASLDEVP